MPYFLLIFNLCADKLDLLKLWPGMGTPTYKIVRFKQIDNDMLAFYGWLTALILLVSYLNWTGN
jgi:hypothetical protein